MAVHGIKGGTNRIRLEEHIPLKTPIRMMIDVSSTCNFHCKFCAQGGGGSDLTRAIMTTSLAKKCIDDLTEFEDRLKMCSFFCFGEPLIQRDLPEIIKYASDKNVADKLEITTNASLLTHDICEGLIDGGINLINISLYGLSAEDYKNFCGVKLDFDKFVREIDYLHSIKGDTNIVVKITNAVCSSPEDEKKFYDLFEGIADKVCIEHPVPFWYDLTTNFDYDENDIYGNPLKPKAVCPSPFYMMCVNATGKVTCCCTDWKNLHTIGDANKNSLKELWQGKSLRNFQKAMLKNGAQHMCRGCRFHELVSLDNIDPYRQELLRRLEAME